MAVITQTIELPNPKPPKRYARRAHLTDLTAWKEIEVRFSEVDAMGIVWHGNYAKYFEDARDAFGEKYDLNAVSVYEQQGFYTPLVHLDFDYKIPLSYGDRALVSCTMVDTEAAKLIFFYQVFRAEDHQLLTEGESIQVFLNRDRELHITVPEFLTDWRRRWGL